MKDMNIEYLKLHFVTIRVFDPKGKALGQIHFKIWDDLPLQVVSKWRWYLDYRAALFKVQNPKSTVELFIGKKEPNQKTVNDFLIDKIKGKKMMITKLTNKLNIHKEKLIKNNIFGLAGDDGSIEFLETKINEYKSELQKLQSELK